MCDMGNMNDGEVHFVWTPEMSVGEHTIDQQHQRLLGQLNAVIDCVMEGASREKIEESISFFQQYVDEHLAYEEAYMRRRGYSDIEGHTQKHQEFRDKYQSLRKVFAGQNASGNVLFEIEAYLGHWWTNHILHEDQKYFVELGSDNTAA